MKETILLFGFSKERQGKLMRALLPLKMKIKGVGQEELWKPLGAHVGLIPPEAEEGQPESVSSQPKTRAGRREGDSRIQELGDEMLVMAGLTSTRIDAVLGALRKGKAGPIPYKAVLTESNQQWNAFELLEELKKEHERFTATEP